MIQHYIYGFLGLNKKKVSGIFLDIELFYNYIQQNGQIFDEWYFNNIFDIKYWNYLNNYKWLSNKETDMLHQGILNLILFLCYQNLEDNNSTIHKHLSEIQKSLIRFSSKSPKTQKLYHLVEKAIKLVENKKDDGYNIEINTEIYKSITWTLKNIILVDKNMLTEDKDKNQR